MADEKETGVGEIPTALLFEMRRRGYPHVHAIYHTASSTGRPFQIFVFVDPERSNPNTGFLCVGFLGENESLVLEELPIREMKSISEFLGSLF